MRINVEVLLMLPIAQTVLLLFKHTTITTILTAETKPRPNAHTCAFPMAIPQRSLGLHTWRIGDVTTITRRGKRIGEPARPACFVMIIQQDHRLSLCTHVLQAAGLADCRAKTAPVRHNQATTSVDQSSAERRRGPAGLSNFALMQLSAAVQVSDQISTCK